MACYSDRYPRPDAIAAKVTEQLQNMFGGVVRDCGRLAFVEVPRSVCNEGLLLRTEDASRLGDSANRG